MSRSLREALNESNPNKLAAACHELPLGTALGLGSLSVVGQTVGTVLPLPEGARARFVAGSGVNRTTGAAVTPTIDALGNLVFAGASTDDVVEGHYFAIEGDIRETEISVVPGTGLGNLPPGIFGAQLLEVEVLEGTVSGPAAVIARGGTPASGQAALDFDANEISFLIADAVTRARVRFVAQPDSAGGASVAQALEGDTNI